MLTFPKKNRYSVVWVVLKANLLIVLIVRVLGEEQGEVWTWTDAWGRWAGKGNINPQIQILLHDGKPEGSETATCPQPGE